MPGFIRNRFSLAILVVIVSFCIGSSVYAAQTVSELQAEIDALLVKLQAPTPALVDCAVPVAPLALGSRGVEVKKLQVWLNKNGYPVVLAGFGSAGSEGEYFGELTRLAVSKFQSAAGIRPTTGFYGPITMSSVRERCASSAIENLGLKIGLSKNTPKSEAVARGSTHLPVLAIEVSGNSVLHSLAIHHYGVGPASGFSKAYLYDGDVRLTAGYSINNKTDSVIFTDINLAIAGTRTLMVVADLSGGDSTNKDGFEIVAPASVSADGVVVGAFPIQGSLFARVDATVGSLAIEKTGKLSNPTIGSSGAKIAEFIITPGMREDSILKSITLKNAGSINSSLISNFVLKQAGVTISTASAINSRGQIILSLATPLTLTKGTEALFDLYADISATASVGDTLRVYVENSVDVYAIGAVSNQGVTVVSTEYNNSASDGSDASWLSVSGGAVTLMFKGPSVINYAVSQNDVELMRFDVSAQDNIEIRRTRFTLTAGGPDASSDIVTVGGLCNLASANYTDIKLIDAITGQVLTRGLDTACVMSGGDTNRALVYTDYWTVGAGQTRTVKLTADIGKFTPATGETIKATLAEFRDGDIKNMNTSFFIPAVEIVPSSNITGATHNVHVSPLVASLASKLVPNPSN